MPTRNPEVTIIAGCYNHAPYISESLESIRKQTFSNYELIITDDCSDDGSEKIIQNWIETYGISCTFLRNTSNKGVCNTLNQALKMAKGKYIAITATDDIWFPNKIASQVALMERQNESVGVLYSDCVLINQNGQALSPSTISTYQTFAKKPEGNIYSTLVKGNFIRTMSTLIRKKCFDKVGLFDERLHYEDYDMWLRLAKHYQFKYSPIIAGKYRFLPKSLSHNKTLLESETFSLSTLRIVDKHIQDRSIDKKQKAALLSSALPHVEKLHLHRHPLARRYLLKYFSKTRKMRYFFYLFFSLFPRNVERKILSLFYKFKSAIRSQFEFES